MSDKKKNWKEAITFLTPNYETHEVNGKALRFYPICGDTMFKLRRLAKPLANALRVLFTKNAADTSETLRKFPNPDKPSVVNTETIISAQAPEIAKLRSEQMTGAIGDLLDTLLDEKNADVLGMLLVDSLRDEFDRKSMTSADYSEFIGGMDVVTQKEMLVGLSKGNKKILGPFGDLLGEALGRLLTGVGSVAEQLQKTTETTKTPS